MRIFLTLLLMLAVTMARAEWVKVNETETGVVYLDPATIRKDGDLRRIWGLTDLKVRDAGGELSRRRLDEYDCKKERYRILSISTHSGSMAMGKILARDSDSGEWQYAAPGSVAGDLLGFVCSK
jgi:hypothetical protein